MNFVKCGIVLFLICGYALAGESKSRFPDQEVLARGLIKKLYDRLVPLEARETKKLDSLYPGKLYEVSGDRLHMFCMGRSIVGVPTVILESGSGSHAAGWLLVQLELSKRARVCAYDRVGSGWSEEWSALKPIKSVHDLIPRTFEQSVQTLDRLLIQAGIPGPILLVGHSYGGPLSLAFEAKHSGRVSGLVFLLIGLT